MDLPPPKIEKPVTPPPTEKAADTKTAETKTPDKAPETKPATAQNDLKPGDNPKRVYQLRELEHGTVVAGRNKIDTWLMDDDGKQEEGMMFLTDKDVKDNQGMLFVSADAQSRSFWMQNTLIPLDIVYIAADGKVINMVHGKPRDETLLPSTAPSKYVLELKDGRASRFGIAPGTKLTIPPNASYKGAPPSSGMPPG